MNVRVRERERERVNVCVCVGGVVVEERLEKNTSVYCGQLWDILCVSFLLKYPELDCRAWYGRRVLPFVAKEGTRAGSRGGTPPS